MTTALNAMTSESASLGIADFKYLLRWRDQSGAGLGDQIVLPSYGGFTTSFTAAGTYSNGSAVVTGISDTIRIQPGMQCTATGFTGTQTVSSVDSATQVTLSTTATGGGGATTLTFTSVTSYNPLLRFGVNGAPGGGEIVARQGYLTFNIEGHFDDATDAVMELYVAAGINGASGEARPFFFTYDKVAKKAGFIDLAPGRDKKLNIKFSNYTGDGDNAYTIEENLFTMHRAPHQTGEDVVVRIDSNTAKNSEIQMSANGDAIGSPGFRLVSSFAGAGGTNTSHRTLNIIGRSPTTGVKTGQIFFRADDGANNNSVMLGVGGTSTSTMLYVTNANTANGNVGFQLVCKTGQTGRAIIVDGLNNDGTTLEANKWAMFPKGYVVVRESGNTSTDRAPSTGSSTATFTATNKPGASTSVSPTMWFPMLSTAGALFWVPGWAD